MLQFSNNDEITKVSFKQFKKYFFISMNSFIELSDDAKSSTQYKKIKAAQISDLSLMIYL